MVNFRSAAVDDDLPGAVPILRSHVKDQYTRGVVFQSRNQLSKSSRRSALVECRGAAQAVCVEAAAPVLLSALRAIHG
jgi:hypothetical protein